MNTSTMVRHTETSNCSIQAYVLIQLTNFHHAHPCPSILQCLNMIYSIVYICIYYVRLTCSPAWIFKSQVSLGFECIQDLLELNRPARSIRKRVRRESSNSNEIARIQASQQVSNKLLLEPQKLNAVGEGWAKKKDKIPSTPNATYLIQFWKLVCKFDRHPWSRFTCWFSHVPLHNNGDLEGPAERVGKDKLISTQQPQIAECLKSERIKP